MRPIILLAVLCCCVLTVAPAKAQHCPPIWESYLSRISIEHDAKTRAIDLKVKYSKLGGRAMPKYQIYLLAYLEQNERRVPAPLPADFIDKQVVRVLHTQAVERNADGSYDFALRLNANELAKKFIEHGRLTEKDRKNPGGWGYYEESFRLAIFIPFLEDRTYSVLENLPEDRHECNYLQERALLFQPLPYSLGIHFGRVGGGQLAEGEYSIRINQAKSR
ncbi:MAG: hypothetical protein IT426_18550 [Pirellulales bacterium]|nr:hypothetical protein [Pirellulales bacterium]